MFTWSSSTEAGPELGPRSHSLTMAQEIKFGTDGWRGIIADDFTFDNVRRVAGAIASYVLKYEEAQRGVFVGYDARFVSPRAAQIVAEVIAAAGIPVKLANDYTPTPAVSYAVKHQGAAGAGTQRLQGLSAAEGSVLMGISGCMGSALGLGL